MFFQTVKLKELRLNNVKNKPTTLDLRVYLYDLKVINRDIWQRLM